MKTQPATPTQLSPELLRKLTKARIGLILGQPFYGTLATRLENIAADVPTARTNGIVIKWNPEYLKALSDKQLEGVVAHEVMHVANGHAWRRGHRKPFAWNTACDKAINPIIKSSGLVLPPNVLYPETGEEGKSAEALYDPDDEQNNPENENGTGKGSPSCGEVEDAPADKAEEQEAEWKIAVAQAAAVARSAGKLPGDLNRLVETILNPRVPWETLLRDFVERTARNDYNWTRPNRRHLQRGFILPSLISDELPAIVIAIDTSGSIGSKELDAFAAETSAVLGAYETTIHLIYCDTRVAASETLTRADLPLRLKPCGGGGTDFRSAFAWVAKEQLAPAAFIYLTDLAGPCGDEPEYPVLWVCTTANKAPWGVTVEMGLE